MSTNVTPIQDSKLISAVTSLVKGCEKLEEKLGIKQNTSEVLRKVVENAQLAQKNVREQKKVLSGVRRTFKEADRAGRKAISNCRLRLAMLFGQEFNLDWEKTGFPDRSTAVPESLDKRQALLLTLEKHFLSTPEQESKDMAATAAACRAAWSLVSETRAVVERETKLRSEAVKVRNKARLMLKKRYRSLIIELGVLISPDDPLWREFGLNPPARKKSSAPEAVPVDETKDEAPEIPDAESSPEPDKVKTEPLPEVIPKTQPSHLVAKAPATEFDPPPSPPDPITTLKARKGAQLELLLPTESLPPKQETEPETPADSPPLVEEP